MDINGRIYQEQVHFQHMHIPGETIHTDHTEQACCCAPCHCTSIIVYSGSTVPLQGRALNEVASSECKVLVVGNPCNTNALIAMENAPRLRRSNFHALMRLDENRAKCQLALKAQRFYGTVTNLCVWGNHSTTQVYSVS